MGKRQRPYSWRPRVGRIPTSFPLLSKMPRARGTPRVQPDPRTSTPRDIEACRNPRITASPPNPRRPARGVCRSIPLRPRWTYRFRQPFSPSGLSGRLSTAAGRDESRDPVTGSQAPAVTGPSGARLARRDISGFDRRAVPPHLRRNVIPRPPLPIPCPRCCTDTPR